MANVTLNVSSLNRPAEILDAERGESLWFMLCIVCVPVCFCGVMFSIFNIVVYSKLPLRTTTYIFLISLSISDFLHLSFGLLRVGLSLYRFGTVTTTEISHYAYLKPVVFIVVSLRRFSVCLHCALITERFVYLVCSLKSCSVRLFKHPKKIVLTLAILAFASRAIAWIKLTVSSKKNRHVASNLYEKNARYFDILEFAVNIAFLFVPFLFMMVFTFGVMLCFRRHLPSEIGRNNLATRLKFHRLTKLVLMTSFAFLIFTIPTTLTLFTSSIVKEFHMTGRQRNLYKLFQRLGFLCDIIGNATNFLFYVYLFFPFRKTFRAVILKPCISKFIDESSVS